MKLTHEWTIDFVMPTVLPVISTERRNLNPLEILKYNKIPHVVYPEESKGSE
jgi:hypothetical protein